MITYASYMVDHSRQLQGVLCALALGIGVNALCPLRLSLAFIQGRMRRAERQGRNMMKLFPLSEIPPSVPFNVYPYIFPTNPSFTLFQISDDKTRPASGS